MNSAEQGPRAYGGQCNSVMGRHANPTPGGDDVQVCSFCGLVTLDCPGWSGRLRFCSVCVDLLARIEGAPQ